MPVSTSPPVGSPIDPRFRQRRIEVRRQQGRRRLRVVAVGLAIIAVGAGIWTAVGSPLLDVDRIEVEGAVSVPAAAVIQAAGISQGDAMLDVDGGLAARQVREGLVRVEQARVRRRWPGTVIISVEERRPSAVTRTNAGSWALLDITGRVLEVVPERPAGLVELEGVLGPAPADVRPGARASSVAGALEVLRSLSPPLAARTAAVVVVHSGEIALKLNPRGTVRFGSADQAAAKVRAIETVLTSVDTGNLAVLDVRLPSSPVLTRG